MCGMKAGQRGDGLTVDMYWMFVAVLVVTRGLGAATLLYWAPPDRDTW